MGGFLEEGEEPALARVDGEAAADLDVEKIDGKWLITNFVGSTTELKI